MKNIRCRFGALIALILCLAMMLSACGGLFDNGSDSGNQGGEQSGGEHGDQGGAQQSQVNITEGDFFISLGDTCQLHIDNQDIPEDEIEWLVIGEAVTVSETGFLTAVALGEAKVDRKSTRLNSSHLR